MNDYFPLDDFEDDFRMDESFDAADRYEEQLNFIGSLLDMPEDDPDWDLHVSEPTEEELAEMDKKAEELLLELK